MNKNEIKRYERVSDAVNNHPKTSPAWADLFRTADREFAEHELHCPANVVQWTLDTIGNVKADDFAYCLIGVSTWMEARNV